MSSNSVFCTGLLLRSHGSINLEDTYTLFATTRYKSLNRLSLKPPVSSTAHMNRFRRHHRQANLTVRLRYVFKSVHHPSQTSLRGVLKISTKRQKKKAFEAIFEIVFFSYLLSIEVGLLRTIHAIHSSLYLEKLRSLLDPGNKGAYLADLEFQYFRVLY